MSEILQYLLLPYFILYFGIAFVLKSMIVAKRIGIDIKTKTELIQSGLFSISRNPIFFGMILSLLGLFFATPNAFTAVFLILGYVLIQIQIRLEEEFLRKEHGAEYQQYFNKVRRFI